MCATNKKEKQNSNIGGVWESKNKTQQMFGPYAAPRDQQYVGLALRAASLQSDGGMICTAAGRTSKNVSCARMLGVLRK